MTQLEKSKISINLWLKCPGNWQLSSCFRVRATLQIPNRQGMAFDQTQKKQLVQQVGLKLKIQGVFFHCSQNFYGLVGIGLEIQMRKGDVFTFTF